MKITFKCEHTKKNIGYFKKTSLIKLMFIFMSH